MDTRQLDSHLGIRLPQPVVDALRARAVAEDRSVSAVVRRAITRDLTGIGHDVRIGDGDARRFEASR